jgi:hypothetical protein
VSDETLDLIPVYRYNLSSSVGCVSDLTLIQGNTMKAFRFTLAILFFFALTVASAFARPAKLGQPRPPLGTTSNLSQPLACPIVVPAPRLVVAPNQPPVGTDSTVGIINALCDVKLNIVGCGFLPTSIVITCDTNGDAIPELMIPLKDITLVNSHLIQATVPALGPQLPGTAFPLACCGGVAGLTLSRHVSAGDDNVFGDFTQTLNCSIDLGNRAPVVLSASPSEGDCAVAQDLIIPGSCFTLADGAANVTSVFAVERGNPSNVIQATRFVILNPNLIDALFNFGVVNSGKTFLILVSGPNGTSRNLTALPAGAAAGCPLGNEQGVQVSFTCKSVLAESCEKFQACRLGRSASGKFMLTITGCEYKSGSTVSIGGIQPRKVRFKDPTGQPDTFGTVTVQGGICDLLPGDIVIVSPNSGPTFTVRCIERCN